MNVLTVRLPPATRVARVLTLIVATLICLSMLGQLFKYGLGHPQVKGFVPLFYLDLESNVPTWYSSAALAIAAACLFLIWQAKRRAADRFRHQWGFLALLLLALSVDEIAMVHELPIAPLRERFQAGGLLYYTWVVPGGIFVLAVAAALWRFAWHLPSRTRWQLFAAGTVFCGGALGVEMISGWQADHYGEENLAYALIITVEECCEMLGVVLLVFALLEYIERHLPPLRVETCRAPTSIGTP